MVRRIFIIAALLMSAVVSAEAQTGTWSGNLDIQGNKLTLVFHLDGDNPTMDSPDQGAKGIPVEVERGPAGRIGIRIPSLGASYEGQWLIRQIAGTFRQMNAELPLTLTPGEKRPNRPQTPHGPFPYETEEVTFRNGSVTLNGTLTLPKDHSRKTIALVMVTGSGQQNRDEEIFGHKPFAVIADALARAGIATLRYDDRGFKGYTGDIAECTVDDFAADALAGVRLLRERFDKAGVIGHSEGGTIALMLAAGNNVDFAVSLAGMAVSGAETLIGQNRTALAAAGLDKETADTYCRLLAEAFNASEKGLSMPEADKYDLPDALKQNYMSVKMQIQLPYMRHFISLDMRPMLGQIACPVMALNGTKDSQVDHQSNLKALSNGLGYNPMNKIEAIDGVNHLFQHCTTGSVAEYREIEETLAPEVLKKIVGWLSELQ